MKIKKIFAAILACVLMFSLLNVGVGAQSDEIFKVTVQASTTPVLTQPAIYNNGDEVSYDIGIARNTGITMLSMRVFFDTNVYEYVGYESARLFGSGETFAVADGYIQFKVDLVKKTSTVTGKAFTLNLKVKDGYCGETNVYASLRQNNANNCLVVTGSDYSFNIVPFESESSEVSIHSIAVEDGIVTDPGCETDGYTTYQCTSCKEEIISNFVDAVGHSKADAIQENRVEPTCTQDGYYDSVVYCSVCSAEISRKRLTINALGHDYKAVITSPDCETEGYTTYTCTVCDYEYFDDYTSPIGHIASDAVQENRVEPTCTKEGSYDSVVYCSVCSTELSRETKTIDMAEHDLVYHPSKAPNCTSIGYYSYYTCNNCDYTTYIERPAIGHNYVAVVTDPTCTQEGYTTYTCKQCGDTHRDDYTSVIDHVASEPVQENYTSPTFESDGYYESVVYCADCGAEISRETVPVLYNFMGDINNDMKINNKDLVILQRYLNNWDVEINIYAADVNSDDKLNNKDYALLMQYRNGWDVVLG